MCYSSKEALQERVRQLEEAAKRDHKKIGKEMELYMIDELIGKGLPVWLFAKRLWLWRFAKGPQLFAKGIWRFAKALWRFAKGP